MELLLEKLTLEPKINKLYKLFHLLDEKVHAVRISEGLIWQRLLEEQIRKSGKYTTVIGEKEIKTDRRSHKVDIFCIDEPNKIIVAYNSKSKSFNNTESETSLLEEYIHYKDAIKKEYPEYTVSYEILKDEYDPSDGKNKKYHYLNTHGIPVHCTQDIFDNETNGKLESIRKEETVKLLREKFEYAGLTKTEKERLILLRSKPGLKQAEVSRKTELEAKIEEHYITQNELIQLIYNF